MKITIRENTGRGFCIRLPSAVIFSRPTAAIAAAALKKTDSPLTRRQLAALMQILQEYRGLTLVEIDSKDGEHIEITL